MRITKTNQQLCWVWKEPDMVMTAMKFKMFEILSGWDSARGVFYFSSSPSAVPYIQHVYRLNQIHPTRLLNRKCDKVYLNQTLKTQSDQLLFYSIVLYFMFCTFGLLYFEFSIPVFLAFGICSISSNRSSMLATPSCLTCHLASTCTWASGLPSKVHS